MKLRLRNVHDATVGWALIDDVDRALADFGWYLSGNGYVCSHQRDKIVYLHRVVMGLQPGDRLTVDHINHDPLDNRRSNLRVLAHRHNHQNRRGANRNSASGVRGVYRRKDTGRWSAEVTIDGRQHRLGCFSTIGEAEAVVKDYRAKNMPYSKEAASA